MTYGGKGFKVANEDAINLSAFLLFRVVEVHRTCEATATPVMEGASLSEIFEQKYSNNKRI